MLQSTDKYLNINKSIPIKIHAKNEVGFGTWQFATEIQVLQFAHSNQDSSNELLCKKKKKYISFLNKYVFGIWFIKVSLVMCMTCINYAELL